MNPHQAKLVANRIHRRHGAALIIVTMQRRFDGVAKTFHITIANIGSVGPYPTGALVGMLYVNTDPQLYDRPSLMQTAEGLAHP